MSKIILHVDMDAFFTACEEQRDPSLKGKPVIVGADPKKGEGRGVVSTCSYSARKFGIHSAMPISKAYRLCPRGIYLFPDFKLYLNISRNIMTILRSYGDRFQQISIDEAFLDITEKVSSFDDAAKLALEIKEEILKQEGITCSIGIGVNKIVAKIGSEHEKPNGLTIIEKDKERAFMAPLPIRKLYGVGPKTEAGLKELGIQTIGDLALFNKELLLNRFGVYGLYLHMTANGIGNDVVTQGEGRSSMSKERTFAEDTDNTDAVYSAIKDMADRIARRLEKERYRYRTISIKVRLADFSTFTRAMTLGFPTNDADTILKSAMNLFQEFLGKKIRLIGVRVAHLDKMKGQKTLAVF